VGTPQPGPRVHAEVIERARDRDQSGGPAPPCPPDRPGAVALRNGTAVHRGRDELKAQRNPAGSPDPSRPSGESGRHARSGLARPPAIRKQAGGRARSWEQIA
jgi:hypothetical protein